MKNLNPLIVLFFIFAIIALIFFYRFYTSVVDDTINIDGEVFYDDYKEGDIVIFWRRDLKRGAPMEKNSIFIVKELPGRYRLKIPKSVPYFYVCARCAIADNFTKNSSLAYFVSDRIVNDPNKSDIRIDVNLITRKKIMDSYGGPTVEIKGKIIQPNYVRGLLGIAIETPENHKKVYLPPDVAHKFYTKPGNYAIEVPAAIGSIYISVLNYPDSDISEITGDMPGVIFSEYKDNPIVVGSSNIEGIDIILK